MSEAEHDYRICDMCLPRYGPRIRELTGEAPKITLHTHWNGEGCDFCPIEFPAQKTVRLPRFLVEGKPQRMVPATVQREEKVIWYLYSFIGENPFQGIAQRFNEFRKRATGLVREAVEPVLLGEQEA